MICDGTKTEDNRPNIIFHFSDQQRADTCGCYGQELSITPNPDRLAASGVNFLSAFTAQPVCGPCRAIFQTGKYPTEIGCHRNNKMLPQNIKTLANYIEEAGYETAYIGKWHLASECELVFFFIYGKSLLPQRFANAQAHSSLPTSLSPPPKPIRFKIIASIRLNS